LKTKTNHFTDKSTSLHVCLFFNDGTELFPEQNVAVSKKFLPLATPKIFSFRKQLEQQCEENPIQTFIYI